MGYHNPVLLNECIEGLNIKPTGTYVDVTFGGGGHSKLILKNLKGGKLFSFDQDESAHKNSLEGDSFKLINANFRYLKNFLRMEGIRKIDGLLADLGVSSHQFDVPERGFSIRFNGDLDMRMNTNSDFSARNVINEYEQQDLANVLYKYGELRNSRAIAREIVNARETNEIITTNQLIDVVARMVSEKKKNQFLARIFQAIRIEVNDEINALKEMLLDAVDMLNQGGRLVVLSYHSLEDRIVKNLIKKGNIEGRLEKDFFGNPIKNLKEITRKVIIATEEEIVENTRSRSAKLRIAEKN
jgi:16S rRNA (cytosine1402-N4)-methyltransferase